jgi:hypothetical protein
MQLHLVKQDAQSHGSALTYAKRYSYMAALGLVADEDDDGNKASQSQQRTRSEAKPKAKPSARAAKQEAAETENLQPLMISEIEGGQGRQAFMDWLKKTHNCTPTRVPVEAKSVVEVAIVAFATGAVNPDGTPQLPEGLTS